MQFYSQSIMQTHNMGDVLNVLKGIGTLREVPREGTMAGSNSTNELTQDE